MTWLDRVSSNHKSRSSGKEVVENVYSGPDRHSATAQAVVRKLGVVEREIVSEWLSELLILRDQPLPVRRKAAHAVRATLRGKVIPAVLRAYGEPIRRIAWSDRSWPARIGLTTAAVTAATTAGEGAGIAALGTAIGVPLWVVLGAGSTFAAVMLDELRKAASTQHPSEDPQVQEAEWEFADGDRGLLQEANTSRIEWQRLRSVVRGPRTKGFLERVTAAGKKAAGSAATAVAAARNRLAGGDVWVGVDGCKIGWFSIGIDVHGEFAVGVDPNIRRVWDRWHHTSAGVLIDIPIGLPSSSSRDVDRLARQMLQGARKSSVFPTPCRTAVYAADYEGASAENRRAVGHGISQQAWAICGKIQEVDLLLQSDRAARARIREIHPEVLFCALNGRQSCTHRKRSREGIEERLMILSGVYPRSRECFNYARDTFSRSSVADDDIVDALAAAVCGWKARGHFQVIGGAPDAKGIPMEMVYWISDPVKSSLLVLT